MDYKDYYKILGIARTADVVEIKKAYRRLAMRYHPDRHPNDRQSEEKFKEINEAFQVLGDPGRRSRYDQIDASYRQWHRTGSSSGGFNWEEWATANRKGRGETMYQGVATDSFGLGDFSEFFRKIFGVSTEKKHGSNTNKRKSDGSTERIQYPVSISCHEAYHGCARKIDIDGRRLELKIPAGSRNGTQLRVVGAIQTPNGQKMDLYLLVQVVEDPKFIRKGNHVHIDLEIDLYTAVLGGEVPVQTLGGAIMLSIPSGTQPGRVFRLAGRGFPQVNKPQIRGDQFIRVQVKIPDDLTEQQRDLFRKLAGLVPQ